VLLGHPHPLWGTCFRRSCAQPGWRRVIVLAPFSHADLRQVAFLEPILPHCDVYLAITGSYWFSSIAASPVAHWRPKMVHLDLAIDRRDFPVLKPRFNPPGQRRFVYIGGREVAKNVGYLSQIAQAMPETSIAWMGRGSPAIRRLEPLGYLDFRTSVARQQVAGFDFMLTVGHADANPTTILEAMAWGLIPVCTPQSGYMGFPGIVNVPLDDPQRVAAILRNLQTMPEATLLDWQRQNWALLDSHFTWDRFTQQVVDAIESEARPPLERISWSCRASIRWAELRSPHFFLRPRPLKRLAQRMWRQYRQDRQGTP
jgi:hypothetical protein